MRALLLGFVGLVLAAACGAGATVPPQVTVVALQFLPPVLPVDPGATVLFVTLEPIEHHIVYGYDGPGGALAYWGHLFTAGTPGGDSFTHTVAGASGTAVLYYCSLHPLMRGVVVVA